MPVDETAWDAIFGGSRTRTSMARVGGSITHAGRADRPGAVPLREPPSAKARPARTLPTVTATIVALAVFGPYVVGGMRTEQLAVYGCALLGGVFGARKLKISMAAGGVIICYVLVLAVALLGAVAPPSMGGYNFTFGSTFAGIDNVALPVAAVLLAQLLAAGRASRERLVAAVCRVTAWAMCANTLLAFANQSGALNGVLSHFWESDASGNLSVTTVAGRSAQLGRLTGIFNQPAEAGVLYGAGLFMAIYLYRSQPKRLAFAVLLLTTGGVITVSKVFILIALPVGAWQVIRGTHGRASRLMSLGTLLLVAAAAGRAGAIPEWGGSRYLNRLLPTGGDSIGLYTAGRFGSGSSIGPIVDMVWSVRPLSGIGAEGIAAAYDNAWVEAFVYAGIIGVVNYTLVFLILWRAWWLRRETMLPGESGLAVGLLLVSTFASVGFPALTGNRTATVLWLILGLTVLVPRHRGSTQ